MSIRRVEPHHSPFKVADMRPSSAEHVLSGSWSCCMHTMAGEEPHAIQAEPARTPGRMLPRDG